MEIEASIRHKTEDQALQKERNQIDLINAETKRLDTQIKAKEAGLQESKTQAEIGVLDADKQLKQATAAEKLANTEAQNLETEAVRTGIVKLVEGISAQTGSTESPA